MGNQQLVSKSTQKLILRELQALNLWEKLSENHSPESIERLLETLEEGKLLESEAAELLHYIQDTLGVPAAASKCSGTSLSTAGWEASGTKDATLVMRKSKPRSRRNVVEGSVPLDPEATPGARRSPDSRHSSTSSTPPSSDLSIARSKSHRANEIRKDMPLALRHKRDLRRSRGSRKATDIFVVNGASDAELIDSKARKQRSRRRYMDGKVAVCSTAARPAHSSGSESSSSDEITVPREYLEGRGTRTAPPISSRVSGGGSRRSIAHHSAKTCSRISEGELAFNQADSGLKEGATNPANKSAVGELLAILEGPGSRHTILQRHGNRSDEQGTAVPFELVNEWSESSNPFRRGNPAVAERSSEGYSESIRRKHEKTVGRRVADGSSNRKLKGLRPSGSSSCCFSDEERSPAGRIKSSKNNNTTNSTSHAPKSTKNVSAGGASSDTASSIHEFTSSPRLPAAARSGVGIKHDAMKHKKSYAKSTESNESSEQFTICSARERQDFKNGKSRTGLDAKGSSIFVSKVGRRSKASNQYHDEAIQEVDGSHATQVVNWRHSDSRVAERRPGASRRPLGTNLQQLLLKTSPEVFEHRRKSVTKGYTNSSISSRNRLTSSRRNNTRCVDQKHGDAFYTRRKRQAEDMDVRGNSVADGELEEAPSNPPRSKAITTALHGLGKDQRKQLKEKRNSESGGAVRGGHGSGSRVVPVNDLVGAAKCSAEESVCTSSSSLSESTEYSESRGWNARSNSGSGGRRSSSCCSSSSSVVEESVIGDCEINHRNTGVRAPTSRLVQLANNLQPGGFCRVKEPPSEDRGGLDHKEKRKGEQQRRFPTAAKSTQQLAALVQNPRIDLARVLQGCEIRLCREDVLAELHEVLTHRKIPGAIVQYVLSLVGNRKEGSINTALQIIIRRYNELVGGCHEGSVAQDRALLKVAFEYLKLTFKKHLFEFIVPIGAYSCLSNLQTFDDKTLQTLQEVVLGCNSLVEAQSVFNFLPACQTISFLSTLTTHSAYLTAGKTLAKKALVHVLGSYFTVCSLECPTPFCTAASAAEAILAEASIVSDDKKTAESQSLESLVSTTNSECRGASSSSNNTRCLVWDHRQLASGHGGKDHVHYEQQSLSQRLTNPQQSAHQPDLFLWRRGVAPRPHEAPSSDSFVESLPKAVNCSEITFTMVPVGPTVAYQLPTPVLSTPRIQQLWQHTSTQRRQQRRCMITQQKSASSVRVEPCELQREMRRDSIPERDETSFGVDELEMWPKKTDDAPAQMISKINVGLSDGLPDASIGAPKLLHSVASSELQVDRTDQTVDYGGESGAGSRQEIPAPTEVLTCSTEGKQERRTIGTAGEDDAATDAGIRNSAVRSMTCLELLRLRRVSPSWKSPPSCIRLVPYGSKPTAGPRSHYMERRRTSGTNSVPCANPSSLFGEFEPSGTALPSVSLAVDSDVLGNPLGFDSIGAANAEPPSTGVAITDATFNATETGISLATTPSSSPAVPSLANQSPTSGTLTAAPRGDVKLFSSGCWQQDLKEMESETLPDAIKYSADTSKTGPSASGTQTAAEIFPLLIRTTAPFPPPRIQASPGMIVREKLLHCDADELFRARYVSPSWLLCHSKLEEEPSKPIKDDKVPHAGFRGGFLPPSYAIILKVSESVARRDDMAGFIGDTGETTSTAMEGSQSQLSPDAAAFVPYWLNSTTTTAGKQRTVGTSFCQPTLSTQTNVDILAGGSHVLSASYPRRSLVGAHADIERPHSAAGSATKDIALVEPNQVMLPRLSPPLGVVVASTPVTINCNSPLPPQQQCSSLETKFCEFLTPELAAKYARLLEAEFVGIEELLEDSMSVDVLKALQIPYGHAVRIKKGIRNLCTS